MAYTEFCCRAGGSNLNAGSLRGDSTEPGTSPTLTYASGTWVLSTLTFSQAIGNPITDGVTVGDFVSIYPDGATVAVFIARVTSITSMTIVVSGTIKMGTAPADGVSNRTLRLVGAWLGPNAAVTFPFNLINSNLVGLSGGLPCVNLKNDQTYAMSASITHSNTFTAIFGYSSTYRDGGRATITNSATSGTTLILSGANTVAGFLIIKGLAASGTAAGMSITSRSVAMAISIQDFFGVGMTASTTYGTVIECESYNNSRSNGGTSAGFNTTGSQTTFIRCLAAKCVGSNNAGFRASNGAAFIDCISSENQVGAVLSGTGTNFMHNCDLVANVSHGISILGSLGMITLENNNFIKNGTGGTGYGVSSSLAADATVGVMINCGFGAGTYANATGKINNLAGVVELGTVDYPSNSSPYVNHLTGDFRISLAQAQNAGCGSFSQGVAGYSGAMIYQDIGSNRHADPAGGSGIYQRSIGAGGCIG
jgi:hypothetical protein